MCKVILLYTLSLHGFLHAVSTLFDNFLNKYIEGKHTGYSSGKKNQRNKLERTHSQNNLGPHYDIKSKL